MDPMQEWIEKLDEEASAAFYKVYLEAKATGVTDEEWREIALVVSERIQTALATSSVAKRIHQQRDAEYRRTNP